MKTGFIILIAAACLFCGCASLSPEEAEARRMEKLKQTQPVLYEIERRQQQEDQLRWYDHANPNRPR